MSNKSRIGCLCVLASFWLYPSLLLAQAPLKQWDKVFGGTGFESFQTIVATADGGYLLGGSSYSGISGDKTGSSRGNLDYWIVKIDGNGTKQWDRTFGGNGLDQLKSIVATPDGGYLMGGSSTSDISGDKTEANRSPMGSEPEDLQFDYWIVKIDGNGNKLWDKSFGGEQEDDFESIVATVDGGYLLVGSSWSGISGDKTEAPQGTQSNEDYWIVKIDGSGTKQWDRAFGGNDRDEASSVVATADGGFLLGGTSESGVNGDKTQPSRGTYDYWIIKIDGNGTKQWDKTFGGLSFDWLNTVVTTPDGGYLLGGHSQSDKSGDKTEAYWGDVSYDYWIVKIDGYGNKQWDKIFGGNENDFLSSIITTADGGYLLGGSSESGISGDKTEANRGSSAEPSSPTNDYWIIKTDDNGNKLWDKTFGGNNYDWFSSLVVTFDGGYLLSGYSISGISGEKTEASRGNYDYWIVKVGGEQSCSLQMKTYGQGGWGAKPKKNNAGAFLHAHFAQIFPQGLTVGDVYATDNCRGYTLRLTSAQAVTDFLPSGTKPRALDKSYINPGKKSYRNVFAAQVVALTLNVSMDKAFPDFAPASSLLQDLFITQGPLACKTVGFVLAQANLALAGCNTPYPLTQLHEAVSAINESFEKASSSAYLSCNCEQPKTVRSGAEDSRLLSKEPHLSSVQIDVFPNPFSYRTSFVFTLAESTEASLEVYTLMGTKIATLFKGNVEAGRQYQIDFALAEVKGNSFKSGTYLYRFTTSKKVMCGRMLYLTH